MTNKDFDEVFAQEGEKKPENPAVAMREQRQARENEARDEFLAAFDADTPAAHANEPAQAAVAAAADAASGEAAAVKTPEPEPKKDTPADDKAKDKDKK